MFRLNRMTDYAIAVLGALAQRNGETVATGQMAELIGLSQPTVAKVSKILLAAGLVETQRGVRGGYRIKNTLANIKMGRSTGMVLFFMLMEACILVS